MARADALVYDEILEILRSQLLVTIPPHVLTGLRGLADKMEKMLLSALEGYGHTFVEPKVELGARFGHLVLRFLDIYQVTQALASVMSNPKQLSDMSRSWREVDFESVRNQAALVCNCRHEDLHQLLEVEFIQILDGLQSSAEPVRDIIVWAEQTSDRLIGASSGANSAAASAGGVGANAEERATMSSRSLLIRWGYVTSQIMRDLTIRSDPAFGAFQILKLFMDDWIALSVLRTVALSTNSVAASVEPAMQNPQFLALSPSGNHFATTNSHMSINAQMMAHTPTTASMMAAMGDFGGMSGLNAASHHGGAGAGYGFDSLSFGSAMDANTFDFTGASAGGSGLGSHGMNLDSMSPASSALSGANASLTTSGGVADSEMSSPADDLVKVEGGP
ncbi:hypothetical protein DL93DRAFT_2088590 [Clavulina sp. PMI_390]|nr:hypothetical protein DL93DRAFT_2088590 [Clavulina sp. PMI_390]